MKSHFLFPRRFKNIGWILFIPGIIAAILVSFIDVLESPMFDTKVFAIYDSEFFGHPSFFKVITNGIADEVLLVFCIVGGLLVGFSKHKNEDELISQIRYESLVWAVYFNFSVVLFATIFVYGLFYLNVMMANMFTLLVFFIIRFHVMLYKLNKSMPDEE